MIAPLATFTGTAICLLSFKRAVKTIAIGIAVIFFLNALLVVVLAEATFHQSLFALQAGIYFFAMLAYVFCFSHLYRRMKVLL